MSSYHNQYHDVIIISPSIPSYHHCGACLAIYKIRSRLTIDRWPLFRSNICTSDKLIPFLCSMEMEIERDKRENWEREMEYLEKWKDMELKPPGKLDIPCWADDFIHYGEDWCPRCAMDFVEIVCCLTLCNKTVCSVHHLTRCETMKAFRCCGLVCSLTEWSKWTSGPCFFRLLGGCPVR